MCVPIYTNDMSHTEERETMNTNLVICEDRSIHRAGCKDSEKHGMYPEPFAEDFTGTTMKDLAVWSVEDWNENTNEETTVEEWMGVLKNDVKPCTRLR